MNNRGKTTKKKGYVPKSIRPVTPQLHITVGTTPKGESILEQDLVLLKAAVLYADHVTLCSVTSTVMVSMAHLADVKLLGKVEFTLQMLPLIERDEHVLVNMTEMFTALKVALSKAHPNPLDRLLISEASPLIDKYWSDFRKVLLRTTGEAGTGELIFAIETGLVDIHLFKNHGSIEALVHEYFDTLSTAILNGKTFTLLDDASGDLMRYALSAGMIEVPDGCQHRMKHCALAADMLRRLPLFDEASMAEVIHIRRSLDKHVSRFRSAMIKFSDGIQSATWDDDFPHDAELVFLKDVAPAVQAIEEEVRANKIHQSVGRGIMHKPWDMVRNSAIGVFLGQHILPHVVATELGVGAAGLTVAYDVYKDWKDKRQATEKNDLFFYYAAGQKFVS